MQYIFTLAFITALTFCASAQTAMTIHLKGGSAQTFLLSNVDSITYGTGSTGTYTIGSTGPGGGIVFYDKGTFSNGWRYLEIHNSFLNNAAWGCQGTSVAGTSDAIGTGLENTQLIVSACSTPGIAARISNNLSVVVNGVTIDDWFSPSADELNQVYMNKQNIPLLSTFEDYILSSTQSDADYSYYIDFNNGSYNTIDKAYQLATVAIRRF